MEGIQLESRGAVLGIHATLHDGRPVLYAADTSVSPSWLFEVDAGPVAVPPIRLPPVWWHIGSQVISSFRQKSKS